MIDVKHLRQNPEDYKQSALARGLSVDIDALLMLDSRRTKQIGEIDELRAKLNLKGKPNDEQLAELKQVKADLEVKQAEFGKIDAEYAEIISTVPNLMAEGTPDGGEESNRQEKTWGDTKKLEGAKDHLELAEARDWLDFERGAKVSGSKFYYVKGDLVRLEMALMRLAADIVTKHGFTLLKVPHMVSARIMAGTGFLPRGEEPQVYQVKEEDLNLIATAEIPLTGYHADEVLELDEAKKYVSMSPCYRREAGAYGKFSKGLYRVHQFDKLEMYVFCKPEDAEKIHEEIMTIEEEICQVLEIPYRVVRIAAGDLGAPAYKKYDVEYWSPVEGEYRELTSCSNVTDYQARRLNIRYRAEDGLKQAYTLNGTAMTSSRGLIALLENHQTPDGKISLPEALQQYYGGQVV